MIEKASALFSVYVLDGIQQELTPARLLEAVSEEGVLCGGQDDTPAVVVDETIESVGRSVVPVSEDPFPFLGKMSGDMDRFPLSYAEAYTRMRAGSALVDALWKKGRFTVGDLSLEARWKINGDMVGCMAAFYHSVQAASEYVDALGLKFSGCEVERADSPDVEFTAVMSNIPEAEEDTFVVEPFRTHNPWMMQERICQAELVPDPKSWVVYIPFDTADFRLGGSAFATAAGVAGAPPRIEDADYFMDCFEVIREFAEDGILLSAATVGRGGLLKAVSDMAEGSGCGMEINVSDIMRAYQESSSFAVVFSEIPGALIQIRDSDFDYVDAELLLQDVAYYPLGHPVEGAGLSVCSAKKPGIETILDSLMQNAEGED